MNFPNKAFVSITIILSLNLSLFAGDNSRATLGDVKEAIYKLIQKNKEASVQGDSLSNEIKEIKISLGSYTDRTDDAIDKYIDLYVVNNDTVLKKIIKD